MALTKQDLITQRDSLRAYVKELRAALYWCGGADAFAPGGVARAGWEKTLPLLTPIPAEEGP